MHLIYAVRVAVAQKVLGSTQLRHAELHAVLAPITRPCVPSPFDLLSSTSPPRSRVVFRSCAHPPARVGAAERVRPEQRRFPLRAVKFNSTPTQLARPVHREAEYTSLLRVHG